MHLGIETVIGTGDPLDGIMLLPLLCAWGVPRGCLVALRGESCEEPVTRLYVLREPVEGYKHLCICEKHHQELLAQSASGQGEG